MAEYIERTEELVLAMNAGARAIEHTWRYYGAVYTKDLVADNPQEISYLLAAKALLEASDAPAADVAPVVYGRWKYYHKRNKAVCTCCSFERDLDENFGAAISCPNCGAKMDGGVIDADALIADSCKDCPEEIRKLCKDCKYTGGDFVCYRGVMVQHKPEDFCSYGKRRGGGEDG